MADITEDLRLLKQPPTSNPQLTHEGRSSSRQRCCEEIDEKSEELREITRFHIRGRIQKTHRGPTTFTESNQTTKSGEIQHKNSATDHTRAADSSESSSCELPSQSDRGEGEFYCGADCPGHCREMGTFYCSPRCPGHCSKKLSYSCSASHYLVGEDPV